MSTARGPGTPAGRRIGAPELAPYLRWMRPQGLLLFVLPTPLLLASIIALGAGRFGDMLADAVAFGLFMSGAVLTKRGLRETRVVQQRRQAGVFRISQKNLGAGVVATATAVAAYFGVGHGPAISLAFAGVSLAAFHLLYGLDPVRRSRAETGTRPADQVATQALADARQRLVNIEEAAARIGNTELRGRLNLIVERGREILELIERRPGDVRRARKFLNVYLEGAERVSRGYAETHRLSDSGELEQRFRGVLVTIERVFKDQKALLLEQDLMDLDVQIEVLTKQLEREGIL